MQVRRDQILGNRLRDEPYRLPVAALDLWLGSEDKEVIWELVECLAELEIPWTEPPLGRDDCLDRLERVIVENSAGRYWAAFMLLACLRRLASQASGAETMQTIDRRLTWVRRAATHMAPEVGRCVVATIVEHLPEDPVLRSRFLRWKGDPEGDGLLSTARWGLVDGDLEIVEELLDRGTSEMCGNLLNTLSLELMPDEEINRELDGGRDRRADDELGRLPKRARFRDELTVHGETLSAETLGRIRRLAEGFLHHPSPWVSGNAEEIIDYVARRQRRERQS